MLGLPVGQHIKLYAPAKQLRAPSVAGQWNGREDPAAAATEIERKYTPTTSDLDLGYLDLVVKVWLAPVRVCVRVCVCVCACACTYIYVCVYIHSQT